MRAVVGGFLHLHPPRSSFFAPFQPRSPNPAPGPASGHGAERQPWGERKRMEGWRMKKEGGGALALAMGLSHQGWDTSKVTKELIREDKPVA